MHKDHDVFIEGIEQEKRLELTFFNRKLRRDVVSLCAPLHYGKSLAGVDDMDCYYLWDFEAEKGSNFLALSPSQIVSMELTEDDFCVYDFYSQSKRAEYPNT